ncbi:MAG TPA: sensor histidine kinase [Bacteroidales bacterium]|jgi:two-component sensor histidine kinase|nr:sensor histidine kinase [Bacteroidales bacterium]
MKDPLRKQGRLPAYLIYAFLWLFFLIIPVITASNSSGLDLVRIRYDWLRMLPFFIVFLFNILVLLPFILFRGHTKIYLISLILVVSAITGIFQVAGPALYKNDPDVLEQRILRDPQFGREEMKPGGPVENAPSGAELFNSQANERRQSSYPAAFQIFNTFIISLLIAGFSTAIAMTNKWLTEEQARREAEREHIRTELAFLQNQISPHFFMNTLNNIHALVDADTELARDAILKLSGLMRYLLYESGRGRTTLSQEVEFLRSYINLMQLRVDKSVRIVVDLPENPDEVTIPPLLFISFIENAFKHGVSYREESSLYFSLKRNEDSIEFVSVNTVPSFINKRIHGKGGIGLQNIKKRLQLLYGDRCRLLINDSGHEYSVNLTIPANG